MNDNIFLNPTTYFRALEWVFSTSIYVFDVFDDTNIRMSIPCTKIPYIWEDDYHESIIILPYTHTLIYLECKIVVGHMSDTISQCKRWVTIC